MASSEYVVERSAIVSASAATVFDLISNFHRWREWSPWEGLDPNMQRTFSGPEAGTGAVYEWDGDRKAGAGRMEITQAVAPSRVQIALQFLKPFKASNTTTFELEDAGGSTRVLWRMTGAKTLLIRVMGLFKSMDKMVGPDFERGLAQLKAAAEAG